MKKTLATLLVVALVASLCGVMFVSAETVNLVAGKTYEISEQFRMGGADAGWGWDPNAPISYPDGGNDLTDGLIPEADYAAAEWMAFTKNTPSQTERGYAYVIFDLGAVCELDTLSYVSYKHTENGIQPAHTVEVFVSNDGENYELAATQHLDDDTVGALENLTVHKFDIDLDASAQYVKMHITSYGWAFLGEVEVMGTAPAGSDEPVEPDAPVAGKNWENTMVEGEDGNYSCEVPYGYTWNVNYVDGTIGGEDVTVCTTQAAYDVCNPNWAITVYLEKQADGTYVALQDAIVTPGSAAAAGITIGENQIALVAHSAYSNPNGSNWQGKVVAMSVKAGDVFTVSDDFSTVVAVDPNAAPETPDTPITGDTGILVFAVLAVVAIAGCAVASKIKSSAL